MVTSFTSWITSAWANHPEAFGLWFLWLFLMLVFGFLLALAPRKSIGESSRFGVVPWLSLIVCGVIFAYDRSMVVEARDLVDGFFHGLARDAGGVADLVTGFGSATAGDAWNAPWFPAVLAVVLLFAAFTYRGARR